MYSLILLFFFGLGIGFFSTENVARVPLSIANYTFTGIPLYQIVLISLLIGVALSWVIGAVDTIASMVTIHQKNKELSQTYATIQTLQDEKQQLAIENARLQGAQQAQPVVEERTERPVETETTTIERPSFIERLRQSIQPNYKVYPS